MRRLSICEHRSVHSVDEMWWTNFLSNSKVKHEILGLRFRSLERALNRNRLNWLRHTLRKATVLYSILQNKKCWEDGSGWPVDKVWIFNRLICSSRPPCWDPRVPWLSVWRQWVIWLYRNRWSSCIRNLSSCVFFPRTSLHSVYHYSPSSAWADDATR